MKESPRFSNLDGLTKKGVPAYYKTYRAGKEMESLDKHGYMMVAPHVEINVPGYGEMSGTSLRQALKGATREEFQAIMGWFDQESYDILQGKLEEISTSASISGGFTKGPFPGLNIKKFNQKQAEDSKLRGAKEFIGEEDEIVNEVMNYLLGISVG